MGIRFIDEGDSKGTSGIRFLDEEQPTKEAPSQAEEQGLLANLKKAMTPSYSGGVISGISKGVTDPFAGVTQLALKGASAAGIPGAEQQAEILRQREKQYDASRADGGFDVGRLAGNIMSPLSYITGPGTGLMQAATTGAVQAAMQPVANEDYLRAKATQIGVGATVGPAIQTAGKLISKVSNLVKGLTPEGRSRALNKYLNTLAGDDKDAVIKALQDNQELVSGSRPTAAEVLADVPSAVELIQAQYKLAQTEGLKGKFAVRAAENQAARARAIQGIAGTEAERAALIAERGNVTGSMREMALKQANEAAPVFTKLEKEIADGFNNIASAEQTAGAVGLAAKTKQAVAEAGKPGWLTAGDIATDAAKRSAAYSQKAQTLRSNVQMKQYQMNSLEQNGFFPLKVSDITDRIDSAMKGTSNDVSKSVLQNVRDLLVSKADDNGIIGSRDLYENVRKPSNQQVAKWLGLNEQYASGGIPKQAADTLTNVKKFIDASLDKSTEGLWSKYLKNYSEYSNKLNRMEVGDFLAKKLNTPLDKERAGVFANAIENAANTIKRSTGIPRFERLEQVLTEKEVATVNSVLADLNRKAKAAELAGVGGKLAEGTEDVAAKIPNMLSRTVAVVREGLQYLQQGNKTKFNQKMAELSLDPPALAKAMTTLPKSKIEPLTNAIMKYSSPEIQSALVNSFTVQPVSRVLGE